MKALVNEICEAIKEQVLNQVDPTTVIIKIEDMPHPQVFSAVHLFAVSLCSELKYELICKVARRKVEQLRALSDPLAQNALKYLSDHELIDVDDQMTKWRNQMGSEEETTLILLMGTEAVEDKGGLHDFHLINQATLSRRLDHNYAVWFQRLCRLDSEEIKGLNQILNRVFLHVPEDLFKLSSIIDMLERDGAPQTGEELIVTLLSRLNKDWGIPRIVGTPFLGAWDSITRLIDEASGFRDREGFKDQLSFSQLKRIENRITAYFESHPDLDLAEVIPGYPNRQSFQMDLQNYVMGARLEEVRPKLFACDFSLIRDALSFRLRKRRREEKPTKVHGAPLQAFASALLHMFSESNTSKMKLAFVQARLADCSTDEELLDEWRRICMVAGGLLKFLSNGLVDAAGNLILDLEVSSGLETCDDPFQPSHASSLIKSKKVVKAPASRRLSTVEFVIAAADQEKSFIWGFEPNSGWVLSFALLTEEFVERLNLQGTRTLPIWSSPQIHDLVQSKTAEEFFDILGTAEMDCSNVLDHLQNKLPGSENARLLGEVSSLAEKFTRFVNDLWKSGLYSTMLDIDSSSGVAYVQAYCDLLKRATDESFTSMVINQLHTLVNAFLIHSVGLEPDNKGTEAAIVPPVHPAMLEKVQSQAQFMRQGLSEVIQKVIEGRLRLNQALRELEHLEQLSTITSAVDILKHKTPKRYLACTSVFGAYAVYKDADYSCVGIQRSLGQRADATQDEDFSASEMLAESPLSRVVSTKILDYVSTFPARLDGLRVAFVNPSDLQPIVAGMHEAARRLSKTLERKLRIELTILAPVTAAADRRLLDYWLDHFFDEGDRVEIRTFFRTYDNSTGTFSKAFNELMPSVDITFLHGILETVSLDFERCDEEPLNPNETRFPMVYSPLPVSKTSINRKRCISQPQFGAARQHAQLIRRLDYEIKGPGFYRVVQELSLSDRTAAMMSVVHEKSRWVVTTDPGIDRDILRKVNASIIGFSTGEGPFGELNVTISSTTDVREDIRKRLIERLRVSFGEVSAHELAEAADHCLAAASRLDGADILGALNPNDYDLHNFLAHLLTMKYCEEQYSSREYLIQNLIRLDSHRHWFAGWEERNRRPDFLLLQVPLNCLKDDIITIEATLLECKMGHRSEDYLADAEKQLDRGLELLSHHWNPESVDTERRYWYAQLYRSLVFSHINLADDSSDYVMLVSKIQRIIKGQFRITWKKRILAFWLDESRDSDSDASTHCVELGRHSTWRMILPVTTRELAERASVSVEPQETESQSIDVGLADTRAQTRSMEHTAQLPDTQPTVVELVEPFSSREFEHSPVSKVPLRLLIGEDILTHEPVYWEYGHEQLPNRHLLVTGNSGTGKTYFIQAMLLELSRQGVSSVVFDYTDGFTPSKLEKPFVEALGSQIVQLSVYNKPFPVNPFTRYEMEVAGQLTRQSYIDVAERLKSVFKAVYDLGEQQANAIYNAVKNGLERRGDSMSLPHLRQELEAISSRVPNAKTVLSKIQPLLDRNPFDSGGRATWEEFKKDDGTVFIVQLSGLAKDVQMTLTEIILWDAWYHRLRVGDKNKPFPVVLDEAQNLDHSEQSPTAKILTEGRKFGWSGWFAAQFLKGQMRSDEIERLQQASQKVIFNPPETEVADMAGVIEPDHTKVKQWHARLARLQKGQCVVSGFGERGGAFHRQPPRIVKVTSIEDRV